MSGSVGRRTARLHQRGQNVQAGYRQQAQRQCRSRPAPAVPTRKISACRVPGEKVPAIQREDRGQSESRPHRAGDDCLLRGGSGNSRSRRGQHIPEVVVAHRHRVSRPEERICRWHARASYRVDKRRTQRMIEYGDAEVEVFSDPDVHQLKYHKQNPGRRNSHAQPDPPAPQARRSLPEFL